MRKPKDQDAFPNSTAGLLAVLSIAFVVIGIFALLGILFSKLFHP